jgi:hypothetical protein
MRASGVGRDRRRHIPARSAQTPGELSHAEPESAEAQPKGRRRGRQRGRSRAREETKGDSTKGSFTEHIPRWFRSALASLWRVVRGIAWQRSGAIYFGHSGSDEGFRANLTMNRDAGYGAVVMVNSDDGVDLADEIFRGIAAECG